MNTLPEEQSGDTSLLAQYYLLKSQLKERDIRIAELEKLKKEQNLAILNHLCDKSKLSDKIKELEHLLLLKSTEAEVAQKLYEEIKTNLSHQ
jgi:hypothetical protein